MITDFTSGSVTKQMFVFAIPLILSGLLQTVYSMVDMIIVGKFVGSTALSAVSIGSDVLMCLTFVSMGIASAGQVIISQYIGAGKQDNVRRLIGTLFTTMLGCALVMTVLCLILNNQILSWVNTPADAWNYTKSYVITCACGLFFIYGYNLVSAILRGMGDSKRPFLFIAIASVINLILDILFVGVLGLAAFGAALATVIGQAVSFICALIILFRRREQFGFDFRLSSFRIHRDVFFPLLKLGIPMIIQSASITFSKLFVSSWINSYGVIASAVSGIGNKLDMVVSAFIHAISTASGSMAAQNIGARKFERVPKILVVCFLFDAAIVLPITVITLVFPNAVFGLFCSEQAVMDMALTYIPVCVILYTSSMLRAPMFTLINGSGNSKLNLAVALLDGVFVRIGLALLLGLVFNMGVYGFWYGNAISGYVPFFIGGVFYLSGNWKKKNAISN
jgi:putative MATE family efflux protein